MEVVCPKCKETRTLTKKPKEDGLCTKCSPAGRPRDSLNHQKTAYWNEVPDDHKCITCKRTKHEGASFYVIKLTSGRLSVKAQCNLCKGAGFKYPRQKPMVTDRPNKKVKQRLTVKERVNEYFKTKEY